MPTSVTVDDATLERWAALADAWTGGNRSRALALALALAAPLVPRSVAELGRVPDTESALAWAERLASKRDSAEP
jgi:hypothetical protein